MRGGYVAGENGSKFIVDRSNKRDKIFEVCLLTMRIRSSNMGDLLSWNFPAIAQ